MRGLGAHPATHPASGAIARSLALALILLLHLALLRFLLNQSDAPAVPQAPLAWLQLQLLSESHVDAPPLEAAPPLPAHHKPVPKPAVIAKPPPTDTRALAEGHAPALPLAAAAPIADAQPDQAPPLEYLIRIARLVSRSQRYPWSARQYGQQGDVLVRVHLHRDGRVLSVRLLQSSGVAALDDEACAVMLRIARFPPFPASYLPQIAEFDLDQPVNFRHYQN